MSSPAYDSDILIRTILRLHAENDELRKIIKWLLGILSEARRVELSSHPTPPKSTGP